MPASQGWFKVSGPAGQDVVSWLVSPVDLGRQYRPLPPPPAPDTVLPSSLKPRCDDTILKARGDCIDTSAGVKPVQPRELMFIQDNNRGKESVVLSSPAPQSGPVVYELRLAHRLRFDWYRRQRGRARAAGPVVSSKAARSQVRREIIRLRRRSVAVPRGYALIVGVANYKNLPGQVATGIFRARRRRHLFDSGSVRKAAISARKTCTG